MAENDFLYQFRLILIGESAVGKSSILKQFKEGGVYFSAYMDPTVGVDFHAKLVRVNGQPIKLQIWDTAGQDKFRAIVKAYYRNAVGGLLVYDVTNRESFLRLDKWLEDATEYAYPQKPTFILVGNKLDQENKREVSTRDGQRYADDHGIEFIETSAKTGSNIDEVFQRIATTIYNKIEEGVVKLGEGFEGVKRGELGANKRPVPYRDNGTVSFQDNAQQGAPPKKGCCN